MDYNIRKINENEYTLLDDFLYEAIFIPEGVEAPPKSIINQPDFYKGYGNSIALELFYVEINLTQIL